MEIDPRFVERIYRRTFRIVVENDGHEVAEGTAFCFAIFQESRRAIVATAKHIVMAMREDKKPHLIFQRYSIEDELETTIIFEADFRPGKMEFGYYGPGDIAFVYLPLRDTTGRRVFESGEIGLPTIPKSKRIIAGGWMGWAGFPGIVREHVHHPQLCFFQGTLSAFTKRVDAEGDAYLILDGHMVPGMSGGPVWSMGDNKRLEIVGILSSFGAPSLTENFLPMPGFCCCEPIIPLLQYAEQHL